MLLLMLLLLPLDLLLKLPLLLQQLMHMLHLTLQPSYLA